ncbi:hypothetical protein V5H41_28345, partial [Salmonella enterica]
SLSAGVPLQLTELARKAGKRVVCRKATNLVPSKRRQSALNAASPLAYCWATRLSPPAFRSN